jgi:hypothetical protein
VQGNSAGNTTLTIRQLYYWLRKETLKEQTDNTVQWLPVSLSSKEDTSLSDFLTVKVDPAVIEVRQGFDEELLLHVVKELSALC